MERSKIIDRLIHFHLGRQEAIIYLCLIEHGQLTGYEASKLTGISRSNVYKTLSTLVDKGAAMMQEAGNATCYRAVDLEEFLENQIRSFQQDREYLLMHMPKRVENTEGYFTIQGSNHILDKAVHLINSCKMRLYLAASEAIIDQLTPALIGAKNRGLKIVIISAKDEQGLATNFYADEPETGQIRLITDSAYVLTGELTGSGKDTCLYSGQENLVTVMKEALRNKIRLLEIEGRKGKDND